MKIRLSDIPPDGESFKINRNTAELNSDLQDLLGKHDYQIEFFIRPVGNGTYELKGDLNTDLDEQCSRCGEDFELPIAQKFIELLLPKFNQDRTDHFAKSNHFSDLNQDGPSTYEFRGDSFDAGEYFHEVVALAVPFTPAPPLKDNGNCQLCDKPCKAAINYEQPGWETPESPFAALKGLKLN